MIPLAGMTSPHEKSHNRGVRHCPRRYAGVDWAGYLAEIQERVVWIADISTRTREPYCRDEIEGREMRLPSRARK